MPSTMMANTVFKHASVSFAMLNDLRGLNFSDLGRSVAWIC